MLPNLDECQKRAHSFILQAQKLYFSLDEFESTTSEECCESALRLLKGCEASFAKSVLTCEANIWMFVSVLQRLRLLHVELDPSNSSDDLFAPIPPRDTFEPKAVEKLSAASFRDGFDRLQSVHEQSYRLWMEEIMPRYSSLRTVVEKRAVVSVTNKLASISLLCAHPICALDLFYYLWQWSKCATALRWLVTLLVAFGFPVTALVHIESSTAATVLSNSQPDKHGTNEIMEQVRRLVRMCSAEANEDAANSETRRPIPQVPTAVCCRVESLASFVDCFASEETVGRNSISKRSAADAMTRSRQCAGQLFSAYYKMDTCATLPSLDNSQHIVDMVWYLHVLLNDALVQQRIGNAHRSLGLLMEGFSISFVLCSPYWLLKFTTQLSMLRSLCQTNDDVTGRLIFIRRIFSQNEPNSDSLVATKAASAGPLPFRTPMRDANSMLHFGFSASVPAVELSRRMETGECAVVSKKLDFGSSDSPSTSSPTNKSRHVASISSPASSIYCRCCHDLASMNESIFLAVAPSHSFADDPSCVREKCFQLLRSIILPKTCSRHSSPSSVALDAKNYASFIQEPLWHLLNFCLLFSSIDGNQPNTAFDEVAIVEKALDRLSEAGSSLFSLYYRLTFSTALIQWRLSLLISNSKSDVADLLSKLQLDGAKENAPKSRRRGRPLKAAPQKNVDQGVGDLKLAITGLMENVRKYRHLQYYPWYRWSSQLIALLHLPSVPDGLRLQTSNWKSTSASMLLEASAVSFRHSLTAKESSDNSMTAEKLLQLPDENSLMNTLDTLPVDWTVVSLHLVPAVSSRCLILCRLSSRCRPIVVELGDVLGKFDAPEAFSSFAKEVEESIKVTEKRKFWARRAALETKVAALLKQLETDWFGYYKALLCGYSAEKWKTFSDMVQDADILEVLLTAGGILDEAEAKQYLSEFLTVPASALKRYLAMVHGSRPGHSSSGPVFLILDKELCGIAWENMQLLRQQPVCRIPCLQYLMRAISSFPPPKFISSERVFYVVNPSRDLPSTEECFKWFSSIATWSGVYSNQPDLETMKAQLAHNEVYIYCGHNSGVKCLQSSRRIAQLSCKAVVILMGCGSARAIDHGPLFEPDTVPYHYLVADSPCVIGCLWSVTAPDIDRYLCCVLKLWLKAEPATPSASPEENNASHITSVLCAIAQAKSVCKLPLLTGGSVVAFGSPVFCDKPLSCK